MKAWHDALQLVLDEGEDRSDRTGTGTKGVFGASITANNYATFPAVTTKRLAFHQVKAELSLFLRGENRLEQFHAEGCTIWDKNAAAKPRQDGTLGRIYGVQWRDWRRPDGGSVDQLASLLEALRQDPSSRRHLVTAWNPGELEDMTLPPCPFAFQVSARQGRILDMVVYQRSCDAFLGLPFDIAGHALLQRLIAKDTNMQSGRLTMHLGDLHIYNNHIEQAQQALERQPKPPPTLAIQPEATTLAFRPQQAQLQNYDSWPPIAAPLNA